MNEGQDRILSAARQLFLAGGPDAVTMRGVAARVGVTATALYRHFENKDALLQAVITSGFQDFGAYLYRALVGTTPRDRMRRSGAAYLDFALGQPETYRTIFMSPRPKDPTDPCRRTTFNFLVDRVRECIETGVFAPDDPDEVALQIWAHVHGLVSLQLTGSLGVSDKEFRRVYARSVERLLDGLAP